MPAFKLAFFIQGDSLGKETGIVSTISTLSHLFAKRRKLLSLSHQAVSAAVGHAHLLVKLVSSISRNAYVLYLSLSPGVSCPPGSPCRLGGGARLFDMPFG